MGRSRTDRHRQRTRIMNVNTAFNRRSSSTFAAVVCLSCVLLFCLLNIIIPRQDAENSSLCSNGIQYLLREYKELLLQKKMLQKEKYLEVKELKSNLKKATTDLELKEKQCSSDIRSLNTSVHIWQKRATEMQRLLDGAFSTMDRSSVVLTVVLTALEEAELKVEQLEAQLAGNKTSSG